MFRDNALKEKLRRGEKPVGCWVFLSGGDTTELLSLTGFDAFVIDHEHIFASPHRLIEQMRAAQASEATCLVRVPSHDPVTIQRTIDTGIEGIIVPTLETAEQARDIVAACRYRPHGGQRGVGYPETRAADWGLREVDYPSQYRDRLLIAVIIETRRGVENIEAIAAVDGIDMIIPGSGDLLADLVDDFDELSGYGSYDHPELSALIGRVEEVVKRSPKWLGGV
ncbi:MAG: aldolase/citrate lyase family protein, partial [Alphaproteobacteria bacterium]|nr:aldolase/citrate lyase family protein [Alphaproteobacteria bacterium]